MVIFLCWSEWIFDLCTVTKYKVRQEESDKEGGEKTKEVTSKVTREEEEIAVPKC